MAIFDGVRISTEDVSQVAVKALFPTTNKFKMLQMLTETNARSQMPLTVLGVIRRRFNSDLLKTLQEEHNLNKIALDRKGRLEASEIFAHPKGKDREDKD